MSDPLSRGRELEAEGDLDGAVEAFVEAGAASEAARVLAMQGRLEDAGHAILRALGVTAEDVGSLPASGRVLAEQAAAFFKSFRPELAEVIGEALVKAGPPPAEPQAAPPAAPASRAEPAAPKPASSPPTGLTAPPSLTKPVAGRGPGARPPAAGSGSFRAPVRGAGESLRAPTGGGSFRPPKSPGLRPPGGSSSFRPPERLTVPAKAPSPPVSRPPASRSRPPIAESRAPKAQPAPASSRPPSAPSRRPDSSPARPAVREAPASEAPTTPGRVRSPAAISSGSFRPPRIHRSTPPGRDPVPEKTQTRAKRSEPTLSASGETVTDPRASRAAGWKDADPAAIERSIEELLAGGRKGAAARIARDAGQLDRALTWFQELGLHYQAGACLRELGRHEEALIELLGVDASDASYRRACFELVEVCVGLGRLDFDTDRFLTPFVDEGPADVDEVEGFLSLSRLYATAGFSSSARRCALKVVGVVPDHEEALTLAGEARERARPMSARPPRPRLSNTEGLPPLPSIEEFVALAKKHAPP